MKSTSLRLFCVTSFLVIIHFSFMAFDDPVLRINQQLSKWCSEQPVEKVHLHLDKPYYAIGDTIWFKAYIVIAQTNQLSALSGVLNVEFFNPENKLSRLIKLPVNAGVAWGDFVLADSLTSGTYQVRAYTNWMRNSGEEYFFNKLVEVGDLNSQMPDRIPTPRKSSSTADIQFFPEGGDMVDGVSSVVAFKAVDVNGKGIPVSGVIEDNERREVTQFFTRHAGMGSFRIVPQKDKTYQARIKFADGSEKQVALPAAKEKGFVLSVSQEDADRIDLKITVNDLTLKENLNSEINLVAQVGGQLYYAAKGLLKTPVFTASIPKRNFPSGIAQITLFDGSAIPLNERLVFIVNTDQMPLVVKMEKDSFNVGEQVKLNIQTSTVGSFSVSVLHDEKVPFDENNEITIFSNLLLTSDLKGEIEQPNFYLNNISDKSRSYLDLLMLTQGYHRFEWEQVMADKPHATLHKAEKSIEVSGQVTTFSKKPVSRGDVTILAPKGNLFMQTKTDAEGNFKFSNLIFLDSISAVIHARTEKGKDNVNITINEDSAPFYSRLVNYYAGDMRSVMKNYLGNNKDYYQRLKKSIELNEVKITAKYVQPHTSNLGGKGNYDQIITSKDIDLMGGPLSTRLNGKLGSLRIMNGWPYNRSGAMGLIVDGVMIEKTHMSLDDLNPADVSSIELLQTPGTLGIYGLTADGRDLLVINTKRGNEINENINQYVAGTIKTNRIGFQLARKFYVPKYNPGKEHNRSDKQAPTVFWDPHVLTNSSGYATIEFDAIQAGTYRVIIEGVDVKGNLGRNIVKYKVR